MGNRVDDDYDRHAEQQRIQENLQKKLLQEKSQQEKAKFQTLLSKNQQKASQTQKRQSVAQGGLKSLLHHKNSKSGKSSSVGNSLSSDAHSSMVLKDKTYLNRLDSSVHNQKEWSSKNDLEKVIHSGEEQTKSSDNIEHIEQGFVQIQEDAKIIHHENHNIDPDQQNQTGQNEQSHDQQNQGNPQPEIISPFAEVSFSEVKQTLSSYIPDDIVQDLVDEIAVHVNDLGETEFEIQMKDGSLDGVQVKVSLDSQKRVKTTFITNDKESADLIKQSKGQLQARLYKKGLTLGQFEVR